MPVKPARGGEGPIKPCRITDISQYLLCGNLVAQRQHKVLHTLEHYHIHSFSIPLLPGETDLLMRYYPQSVIPHSHLFLQHIFWNVFHLGSIYFRSGCLVSIILKLTQVSGDIDGERNFNPIAVICFGPFNNVTTLLEVSIFCRKYDHRKTTVSIRGQQGHMLALPFRINTLESRVPYIKAIKQVLNKHITIKQNETASV